LVRSGGIGAFEVDMPGFGFSDSSDEESQHGNTPPLSPRG